jgi:hypothetical protein
LAPQGWQDAPEPPVSDRARLIRYHQANIAWAQRHLVRLDTGLAAKEVCGSRQTIERLKAEEREHLARYRGQIEAALGAPALGEVFTMDEFLQSERQ